MTKMHVDLKPGQVLIIGGAAIRLEKKSGQVARLLIEAAPDTQIKPPARMSAPEPVENTHG
ncbi:hypothetical protein ACNJYG_06635 [Pseudomonas sp. GW6]